MLQLFFISKEELNNTIPHSSANGEENPILPAKNSNRISNANRIHSIITHREFYASMISMYNGDSSLKITMKSTHVPPKQQTMTRNLIGLKEMLIKDLDLTRDHVLDGYVLTVTNIDMVYFNGSSINLIVEDKEKFAHRMAIYNDNFGMKAISKTYPMGVEFCIINPYIRMAADGKPMIRVDDPKTIMFTGSMKVEMCYYCGKEKAKNMCGRCKEAKYCSVECQTNDWKILKHNLICQHLKQ